MSLSQKHNNKGQNIKPYTKKKRGDSHDEQRRMTSITRKMHWYMLRGKIARFLGTDILLAFFLSAGWCAEQEYVAAGSILLVNNRAFDVVTTAVGTDLIYKVISDTGRLIVSVSCLVPFIAIGRDRKSTRLNSSHRLTSRMPSSA